MTKPSVEGILAEMEVKHPLVVAYKQGGAEIIDFDYMQGQRDELKDFLRTQISSLLLGIQDEIAHDQMDLCENSQTFKDKVLALLDAALNQTDV